MDERRRCRYAAILLAVRLTMVVVSTMIIHAAMAEPAPPSDDPLATLRTMRDEGARQLALLCRNSS